MEVWSNVELLVAQFPVSNRDANGPFAMVEERSCLSDAVDNNAAKQGIQVVERLAPPVHAVCVLRAEENTTLEGDEGKCVGSRHRSNIQSGKTPRWRWRC